MNIKHESIAIVLSSFLILFAELFLIRFLPAYMYQLGFFTNFILISAFLGMGIGLLLGKFPFPLIRVFPFVWMAIIGITISIAPGMDVRAEDLVFFRSTALGMFHLPLLVALPVLFLTLVSLFACLSQPLGLLFATSKNPVRTYIFDIVGSLLGISVFTLISWAVPNPIVWMVLFSVAFVVLGFLVLGRPLVIGAYLLATSLVLVSVDMVKNPVYWSPYYKITLVPKEYNVTELYTNNMNHQVFSPLSEAPGYSDLYKTILTKRPSQNMLIIGAGTGQDVAAALAAGAQRIDAVEIDPTILSIGKQKHPEQPYQNPKVTTIVDDGRHFLHNTKESYDLIVFALTDSLIANANMSQIRLESYLFTLESFRDVSRVLSPGGRFVLYNAYRKQWLIDRLHEMLRVSFHQEPAVAAFPESFRVFVVEKGITPRPPAKYERVLPTDDWPFFYSRSKSLSSVYLWLLGTIAAVSILTVFATVRFMGIGSSGNLKRLTGFFFLGAAFALVEAKSIAQLTLLFGTTWHVNAIAFGGILISVLAAALLTLRLRFLRLHWGQATKIAIISLILGLLIQYFVPVSFLLSASSVNRLFLSLPYFYFPIFFANLLFAQFFAKSEAPASELGSNVLGLVFGAIVEYTSLIAGYANLSLVLLLFYGYALLLFYRHSRTK